MAEKGNSFSLHDETPIFCSYPVKKDQILKHSEIVLSNLSGLNSYAVLILQTIAMRALFSMLRVSIGIANPKNT